MKSLLAIYPTARKVEEVLKQESGRECLLGHKVLTFPQVVDALYGDCSPRLPVLTPIAERMAVDEALAEARLQRASRLWRSPGLLDRLLGLIRELKGAALEPDDLRRASDGLSQAHRARVTIVADVFERYQALLQRRELADRHDRERQVLARLLQMEASGDRPRLLEGVTQLVVAEIYDFSLLQFMIVGSLIRLVGDACLTIQATPHRVDISRFPDLTWNRFVEDESIAEQALPVFVRRDGRPGRLGFILEHLFAAASAEPPAPDDTLEIVEAPNRYGEVEEVARAIRRVFERAPGDRIRPHRIALLARDLTPYADYIERVFRCYRIPLRLHHGRQLVEFSSAALIAAPLKVAGGGYRRQALEGLLRLPGLSLAGDLDRRLLLRAGYLDRATRPLADCLEDYRRRLEAALEFTAGGPQRRIKIEADLARLSRATPAWSELMATLGRLEAAGTVVEHVERLGEVLRRLKYDLGAAPLGDLTTETRARFAAWQVIAALADAARLLGSERTLTLDEFTALVSETLARTSVEAAEGPAQAVQALSVLDARGLDFDLAFLLGLEDGGMPHYRGEDPILPDELRVALNRPLQALLRRRLGANAPTALGRILRTSHDRNSEDRLLFFLALAMPERRMVLSYPACDRSGNPCAPSPFVDEVLRLLRHPERPCLRRLEDGEPTVENCFERRSFLNWAARHAAFERPEATALEEAWRLRSIERRVEIERRRERYLTLPTREQLTSARSHPDRLKLVDHYNGRVSPPAGLGPSLFGPPGAPRPWSPRALDDLGACGFKFFARQVLGLKEEDEPDYEPSALEFGSLAHDVLSALFSRPFDFRDRSRALAQAREFLGSYRPQALAGQALRDEVLFDLKWLNVCEIVEELVEFECGALAGERAFNQPPVLEQPVAFTIREQVADSGAGTLELALGGRLDRLDLNRNRQGQIDRLRVLDYKTSRSADAYSDALKADRGFGTLFFQLPVYLLGSLHHYASQMAPGVRLEAGYMILRDQDKLRKVPVDRTWLEGHSQRSSGTPGGGGSSVVGNITALAKSALRGEFDVDPRRCDVFCPYRRLCRYDKPRGE